MYSILKIVVSLKLTFILIIFSLGSTYVLDRVIDLNQKTVPDPMSYFQKPVGFKETPVLQEPETGIPVEDVRGSDERGPSNSGHTGLSNSGHTGLRPCSLGDLKLYIEL